MQIVTDGEKPIFMQLSAWIEDNILSGAFGEDERIPSTTEISSMYRINPATALKGMNLLVDKNIICKKIGMGMYVMTGAAEKIRSERKKEFFENYVQTLITEADKLKISRDDIIEMIKRGGDNRERD